MATIRLPPDFKDFLKLLNSSRVEYLVIGGYAVNGFSRATADLDIWGAISPANAVVLEPRKVVRMGVPPLGLEILTSVSGVEFADCYDRRTEADLDGVTERPAEGPSRLGATWLNLTENSACAPLTPVLMIFAAGSDTVKGVDAAAEELAGGEWAEWYRLTPAQRFLESMEMWETYLALGGSLEPEPDTQSPFFDPEEWRENAAHGRAGVHILRRGGV